jgi:hypothetical protein
MAKKSECMLSNALSTSFGTHGGNKLIISSPYPDHLLNCEFMDAPSKELAILLQNLQPNDLPYDEAFNWAVILSKLSPDLPATEFYIVAFRSCLALSSVNSELLAELYIQDKLSHFEASESGGLLKYWFGVPTFDRRNLATCVWINRDYALKASGLPQHTRAKQIVQRGVYESWIVEKYKLTIGGGEKWKIEKLQ